MKVNRRAFLGTLGTATAVGAMSHEARADALAHYMIEQLDSDSADDSDKMGAQLEFYDPEHTVPRGAGRLFRENKT